VTVNASSPITGAYDEVAPLIYAGLKEIGGSFSAEHGIGLEKRSALMHYADPGKLALMRQIKALLDPDGLMNPGKVLAP
jgi:FAD/FMN-containing dehydrogenase